jgi:DEAD/DEAH box helicase domain-containing protein
MPYRELIFDIETQKLFDDIQSGNPADLGVSIVSVYKRLVEKGKELEGQMFSFWIHDLSGLWPLFANVDRIIGFNSLKFDVPVLAPLSPFDLKPLHHFDMLDIIKDILGHRLSLDTLATATLGTGKTDSGLNAVTYWQQSTPESLAKLQHYCEHDVIVTRDLYDYGVAHGHLKYLDRWNTPRIVDVDFSYPKSDSVPQMGLF